MNCMYRNKYGHPTLVLLSIYYTDPTQPEFSGNLRVCAYRFFGQLRASWPGVRHTLHLR